MTARNATVTLPAGTWTRLTEGSTDITVATIQIVGGINGVYVKATTDGTAPTTNDGAYFYEVKSGEKELTMSEMFPGLTGADVLWGLSPWGVGYVTVSHA